MDAFRRLKNKSDGSLIGFYGSYLQGQTYNVILEYADKGTLEQFFQNTVPPVNGEDIISLWNGLFMIIKALKCIHDVEGKGPTDGPQILHG